MFRLSIGLGLHWVRQRLNTDVCCCAEAGWGFALVQLGLHVCEGRVK